MKKSVVGVYVERFSVDIPGKTISGTKASFEKAKKGSGPIYEELARKVASHPDFAFETILPKNPPKRKETYKGMSIPWMRAYIEMVGDKAFAEKFEKVIKFAENNKKKTYPLAKKYFLKHHINANGNISFDYAVAKALVEEYLVKKTELEQAKTKAANALAPTENKQPDPTKNNIIPAQNLAPAGNF